MVNVVSVEINVSIVVKIKCVNSGNMSFVINIILLQITYIL